MKSVADEMDKKAREAMTVLQSPGAPVYMKKEALKTAIYEYTRLSVPVDVKDDKPTVVSISATYSYFGRADMLERDRFLAIRNAWHACLQTAGVLECVQSMDAVTPYRVSEKGYLEIQDRSSDIADRCTKKVL